MHNSPSRSNSTRPVDYTLHIIKANIYGLPEHSGTLSLYAKFFLPNKRAERTNTVKGTLSPTWNKKLNFASLNTDEIRIQVRVDHRFKAGSCIGEAQIHVNELRKTCADRSDASLELYNLGTKILKGTITVRLEWSDTATVEVETAVESVRRIFSSTVLEMRESGVGLLAKTRQMNLKFAQEGFGADVTGGNGHDPPVGSMGMQSLENIQNKLRKLRPFLTLVDEASKIHPSFEATWNVLSSLYKVYQKKVAVDSDIVVLIHAMDSSLSFVNDGNILKDKSQILLGVIQETLEAITECCLSIRKYLSSSTMGAAWKLFSEMEKLENYRQRFTKLEGKLNTAVSLHAAQNSDTIIAGVNRVQNGQNEALTSLGRIETSVATIHERLTSQETRTILPPSTLTTRSLIPPPPTENFTGRQDILLHMATCFNFSKDSVSLGKQKRFVLFGLGGMGKTQLVLKFLQSHCDRFTVQYMIDASTEESIANSLQSIGRSANISDPDANKTLQWLCQKKEDWVLVYDNADNSTVRFHDFIPKCLHGNIIITTRNADLRVLSPSAFAEVAGLDEDSGVSLLLRTAGLSDSEDNHKKASLLTKEFGHLTLAVVQAGSYIATRGLDLDGYRGIYLTDRPELFRHSLGPDVDYDQPVYKTWEISYASIDRFAQSFLSICSFLYREGITEELFYRAVTSEEAARDLGATSTPDDADDVNEESHENISPSNSLTELLRHLRGKDVGWSKLRFTELVHTLRAYSLLHESSKGQFSIHPLVHSWARDRMEPSEQTIFQSHALWLMSYSIGPYRNYDANAIMFFRELLPHIDFLPRPTDGEIATRFSQMYGACGRWNDATEIREEVLKIREELLGQDHLDTLHSMNELATAYLHQRRLDDAESIQRKVVEGRQRLLGSADSRTLLSMHVLAMLYRDQGSFDKAEKVQLEVVDGTHLIYGPSHPDTLMSRRVLASIYAGQRRFDEAIILLQDVIEATRDVLGPMNLETLIGMHTLGLVFGQLGRWDEATNLLGGVLQVNRHLHGSEHPNTIAGMQGLARAYERQGLWSDARKLRLELSQIQKRVLGAEHPDTLQSMRALVSVYMNEERLDDALKLQIEVVSIYKTLFGDDHPDTLENRHALAQMYHKAGRTIEGIRLMEVVATSRERLLGDEHEGTLASWGWLALMYQFQGRYLESAELLAKGVNKAKSVLGPDNRDTLTSMYLLAAAYENLGRKLEAKTLLQEAVEPCTRILGKNHPTTLDITNLLTKLSSDRE